MKWIISFTALLVVLFLTSCDTLNVLKEDTESVYFTTSTNASVYYKKPTESIYTPMNEGVIVSDLPTGTMIKIEPIVQTNYNVTLFFKTPSNNSINSKTYSGSSKTFMKIDLSQPNKLYIFFIIAFEITLICLILYVIGLLIKGSTEKISSPIIYIVIIVCIFFVRSYLNNKSTTEFYNNASIATSSSTAVNPSIENNYSPVVAVDPTVGDTSGLNNEPSVQDAAGILNSQSNENNNQINNSNNNKDISAQDVENIISKGLDIISYLSKSDEWESRTFPFRCSKCGESCTASGQYKERTDEFVPYKDEFPTRWFHTHSWERLK